MKKIILIASVFAAVACSNDNNSPQQHPISEAAQKALIAKYPQATGITWTAKEKYLVAEFSATATRATQSVRMNAWFDNQGTWYMTETDFTSTMLPEAVKNAFAASKYAQWEIDDIDRIEREGAEVIYVIEVEKGSTEMDLYYSSDGILIKELVNADTDYDYEDYIPAQPGSAISTYIQTNYPKARILEIDRDGKYTEVEILDATVKRELLFNAENVWIHTKTELSIDATIPEAVSQALAQSEYSSYRIDDIDHYRTSDGEFYRYELKSSKGDIKIDITTAGVLRIVTSESDPDSPTGLLSTTITEFIARTFTGAKILESEYDEGYLEVDILHEKREKTIRFTAAEKWVDTSWDIRQSELPQAVTDKITLSYPAYTLDDIEFTQTGTGNYFIIELENHDQEITIRITSEGTIL